MHTYKNTARLIALLFIIATATYITGSAILETAMSAPDYLAQLYPNKTQIIIGVLLEYIDAVAVVAIGVLMFPILKKHHESIAMGYVATRMIEGVMLVIAGIGSLSLITLSQQYLQAGSPDAAYFQVSGALLIAESGFSFQIAMIALGMGSLPFCYVLYISKLIPRVISVLGFIGYVALLISAVLAIFGYSTDMTLLLYLPGAVFEILFPLWLMIKGFNASATFSETASGGTTERDLLLVSTS